MESKLTRASALTLATLVVLATLSVGAVAGGGIDAATQQSVVDADSMADKHANETTTNTTTSDTNESTSNETSTNETAGNETVDPGPVKNLPDSFAAFPDTKPVTPRNVNTPSLSGKIRVEEQYRSDTTVELVRNTSTNYTLAITIPSSLNATNVTFYLNAEAISSSQNISNVVAYVDGDQTVFGATESNNTSWIAWEVDHFSTRNVTFSSNTTDTTNETDDSTTNETETNETTTNETASGPTGPGPVKGVPSGVEGFLQTSPLTPQQTTPDSLSGKMRVESAYADNTTVELVRNSSTDYTLAITIPSELNATNVTFYLQREAVESSQNISNVVAKVDGEQIAFGTTNASNSSWIAFEVDHFSTRNVTFTSNTTDSTTNETKPTISDFAGSDGKMGTSDLQSMILSWSGGKISTSLLQEGILQWAKDAA